MEDMPKEYELLCILSPRLEGENLDKTKNEISELVQKAGGVINFKESSKKPLAYPINKEGQGIFLISQVSILPEKVVELLKELKTNKQILRFLINQLEQTKEEAETPKAMKKIQARPKKAQPEPKPSEPKPSEETLKEIDKKLDEIIGDI